MRKSCGHCRRHNSLASRVHQNSPRTWLLASNRMMLNQSRCVARFQPQGRGGGSSGLAKRLCVPPAQGFGHLPAFAIALMR